MACVDNSAVVWGTCTIIHIYLIFLETRIIVLHFAADSMGLSSFNFFLVGSVKRFFSKSAFQPFKVIQGHLFFVPIERRYLANSLVYNSDRNLILMKLCNNRKKKIWAENVFIAYPGRKRKKINRKCNRKLHQEKNGQSFNEQSVSLSHSKDILIPSYIASESAEHSRRHRCKKRLD